MEGFHAGGSIHSGTDQDGARFANYALLSLPERRQLVQTRIFLLLPHYLGLYRVQIHIPAALGDVVRVRDVVAELRTFAADFTNP